MINIVSFPLALLGPLVRPELISAYSLLMGAAGVLIGILCFGLIGGFVDSTCLARFALRRRSAPTQVAHLLRDMAVQPSFTRWGRIGFLHAYWKVVQEWRQLSAQAHAAQSSLTAPHQAA